jgi:hypothetical protein
MGTEFDDRDAMTDPNHEQQAQSHQSADNDLSAEVVAPHERDRELSELVDDLEKRVAAEHEAHAVPGNAAERAHTTPTDTDDQAPD